MNALPSPPDTGMVFGQSQAVSPITPDELDVVIQNRLTPLNEYWGAVFKDSAASTLPGAYYRNMQVPQDDITAPVYPGEAAPEGADIVTLGGGKYGLNRYVRSDVPVLSPEDYKASPYFRPGIPNDGRMTEARAQAKAEVYDADQYRAWLRQNRPWGVGTVAAGVTATLAGSAIDPVNYIPLFGQAFRVANATRLAAVMTRAGLGALDAGILTAAEEPFIASSRRQFGDDVSFADQILDIAAGAALGGIGGAFHGSLERIDRFHPAAVQPRLQALGEAADALAGDRPLDVAGTYQRSLLTSTALARPGFEFSGRLGEEAAPIVSPADVAVSAWQNRVESAAREVEPDAWKQRDTLLDQQDALRQQLEAAVPQDTISEIDAKINYARGQYYDAPYKDKPRYQKALNDLYAERDRQSHGSLLNEDTPQQSALRQQLQAVDTQLRDIAPTISASLKKGEAVHPRPEIPAGEPRAAAASVRGLPAEPSAFDRAMTETATIRDRAPSLAKSVGSVLSDEPLTHPAVLAAADAKVGKPDTFTDAGSQAIAKERGVNPETGDFEEMVDVNALAESGQLAADETKALKEHDATIKRADDYAKAYQAAATCVGRA